MIILQVLSKYTFYSSYKLAIIYCSLFPILPCFAENYIQRVEENHIYTILFNLGV